MLRTFCTHFNQTAALLKVVHLGVYDFQKRSSLIEVSAKGAQHLGRIASVLAHGEGLSAHAKAAEMRLQEETLGLGPEDLALLKQLQSPT